MVPPWVQEVTPNNVDVVDGTVATCWQAVLLTEPVEVTVEAYVKQRAGRQAVTVSPAYVDLYTGTGAELSAADAATVGRTLIRAAELVEVANRQTTALPQAVAS